MNEYAYPHSEEVQHPPRYVEPERFEPHELATMHAAGVAYRAGFEMDTANGHAVEFIERLVSGCIERATWCVENVEPIEPDSIARDLLSGDRAVFVTFDTWATFTGLYGYRVALDLDGDPWPLDQLTNEAGNVVAYIGAQVIHWVLSVLNLEGLD